MKFPIFKNKSELEDSEWSKYFLYIYGEIPNTGYPIDLNTFWLLYTDILEKYNIKLTDQCIKDNNCFTICPTKEGQLYAHMSGSDDMKNTIWINHLKPYKPLPKNINIEVTHVSGGYPMQKHFESVGSWMYYAKGSGIYFNTGNTISFKDHSESIKYFLNINISCPIINECLHYFKEVFTKAKNKGYDSIQYLNHDDMRCGNTAIEIVDLHGIGAFSCGNKTKLNIKSGWMGKNKCICDNHKESMNCLVNNTMIGGYDSYKSKQNITSIIQYINYHKMETLKIFSIILFLLSLSYISIKYIIKKKKYIYIIYLIIFNLLILYLSYRLF